MIEELKDLLFMTLGLGVVCTGISRLLIGRWFTPATWYWAVWVLCLFSYDYVLTLDMLPEPAPLTISVLTDAHMGAFYGFLAMAVFSRILPDSQRRVYTDTNERSYLDSIDLKKIDQLLIVYLLIALALLAYRITTVGKVDLTFLQAARESFIGQDKSAIRPLLWMIPISVPLTIILSSRLSSGSVRLQRPLLLLGICFLTAMADASRMKILQLLAVGGIMVVIVLDERRGERVRSFLSRYWMGAVVGGFCLMGLLQTIQIVRSTGSIDLLLEDPRQVLFPTNLMAYLAQGTSAMAVFYEAANEPLSGGDLTFGFPMKYGALLGLNEVPLSKADVFGHALRALDDPRVARGGISGIGMLLTDFGPENVWLASFCMAATLQILFVASVNRGFLGRALAVCCCMGAMFSVLNLWFLSAPMVMALVWTFLVGRWLKLPIWMTSHRSSGGP